jgi:hypothetical protein
MSSDSDTNQALGSSTRSFEPEQLNVDTARAKEAEYRAGVDISLKELAAKFQADGYDVHNALQLCGYSDEQISEEVTSIPDPEPADVPDEGEVGKVDADHMEFKPSPES